MSSAEFWFFYMQIVKKKVDEKSTWKEKLFCREMDFFVTEQDNGVVRLRGQGV